MKVFEIAIDWLGIYIRKENHNPMTEEHKFYIVIGLIALAAFLGFFGLLTIR